ncbi:MAG: FtsX-like permease family protein, partial [Bacteroidales bacterium]
WTSNNFITYLVVKEGTSKEEFDEKLKEFARKYMGGDEFDEWVAQGNYWEYFLQSLTSIHLESDLNGEFEANGNKTYVYIFSVISVIILLIACINFMNLSTAKASIRAREVGIRKVVGSARIKLIRRFLSESVILSFISLAIALILVELLMPLYGNLVGNRLDIRYFDNPVVIPLLLALALIVGIISGSYPAFFLSSFKPVTVLKGYSEDNKHGSWLRNLLVVFQFAISILLIIGTLAVYNQLKLLQDKDLGFKKEQVLVIQNPGALGNNVTTLKETLKNYHTISDVSGSNTLPGRGFANWGFGAEGVGENFTLNACICDYDFLNTLQIELLKGRFFSKDFPADSCAAILNEKAVELLGWDNPVGKRINNWAVNRGDFTVIGVIRDYHYESLHQEIRPMALFLIGGYYKRIQSYISVRIDTEDIPGTVRFIEDTWYNFAPDKPFEYSFLEEDYDNLYINEIQIRKLFTIFSVFAIFIACLGLFGLASFTADRKTREIGIRKVFGASVPGIVVLLNRQFIMWIVLANLIAWPVTWITMRKWLENFAYRIDITGSWWMFILAAALALVIAVMVVSYQSVKAAIRNPADSLRYE